MRKQTKNLVIISIISIVILSVIIGGIIVFTPQRILTGGGNFYVKSISQPTIISEDTDLKGVWFLINAYSGGGQSFIGTLTPEETKSLSGYSSVYPLTIEASALDEKINYILQNNGQSIDYYTYIVQKSPDGFNEGGTCKSYLIFAYKNAPACPTGTTYDIPLDYKSNIVGDLGFGGYTCWRYCITKKQAGVLSDINPSSLTDELDISLTVNGEKITKTISNTNPNADFMSSTKGLIAQIQYPANGWTGNYPPSTSSYKGFFNVDSNIWKITSTTHISDYISQFTSSNTRLIGMADQSIITYCNTADGCYNTIRDEISKVNSKVDVIRADDMSISQSAVWGNRNNKDNGLLTITLDRQIAVADFIIKVRADWIGIKIDVGKPQIVSSNCADFKSGDNGVMSIQVKNIGTASGTFIGSINCGIIKQSYNPSPVSVKPGEIQILNIPINSGTFAEDKVDNCYIKVQDVNKELNYVTSSTTCHILKPALCVEGDFYPENNCIKKCTDGSKKELKCCGSGEELSYSENNRSNEYGGYYCYVKSPCNNGQIRCSDGICRESCESKCGSCDAFALSTLVGGIFESKKCEKTLIAIPPQTYTSCAFSFLRYLLIPVIFLVAILIGLTSLNKFNLSKNAKIVVFIVILMLSLILGFLTYVFFWIGLFLFIGYVIVRIAINFIL